MSACRDIALDAILRAIPAHYASDAAFERATGFAPKTVSNWRTKRSASYMQHLPELANVLSLDLASLFSDPDGKEISAQKVPQDEKILLDAFRRTETLPAPAREALLETLLSIIRLSLGGDTK